MYNKKIHICRKKIRSLLFIRNGFLDSGVDQEIRECGGRVTSACTRGRGNNKQQQTTVAGRAPRVGCTRASSRVRRLLRLPVFSSQIDNCQQNIAKPTLAGDQANIQGIPLITIFAVSVLFCPQLSFTACVLGTVCGYLLSCPFHY